MDCAENSHDLPLPTAKDREALPHFLVISPPKTGSTWLAANLNCHPEVYIPDIKELDFFNHYLTSKGWEWYADMFRPGLGLIRGEATPSYCLMPAANVELVHSLLPRLKLIYIIREPISRTWSHARHCYRHRQTTFEGCNDAIDKVPNEKWIENFTNHSTTCAGQIVAHLKSWLAFFPREQIYVDFYPSIRSEPTQLLKRIFRFLGVSAINNFSFFQISQRLNEGVSRRLPAALAEYLHNMYAPTTAALAGFLKEKFDLSLPEEWLPLLQPSAAAARPVGTVAIMPPSSAFSPPRPATVPESAPLTTTTLAAPPRTNSPFLSFERRRLNYKHTPRTRTMNYFGYQLIYYKGYFFGIAHEVGLFDLQKMTEKEFVRLEEKGLIFRSPSLEWVKLQVTDKQLAPLYRPPGKPSIAFRARRYLVRRFNAFISGVAGRIQVLSPRVAAKLTPASRELQKSA